MANTINYGRSGRGGKDPRKTLTSAQRSKASVNRRAKEEKDSGRIVTPAGGAGLIIGFVPGIGKGAAAVGKGVYKVGQKIYKTFAAAKKANPKARPNKLVQQLQRNEAAAAKMGKPKPNPKVKKVKDIVKVATGKTKPGPRGTSVTKNTSNQVTGNISGQSTRIGKGIRDMARPAARAAGVVAASAAAGSKKKTDKPLSKLPAKTVATRKTPVPVDDTPRPKRKPATPKERPVQGPKNKPLKPLEGGVRYIDNPFGKGKIKIDSSEKGMWGSEPEYDYAGGRVGQGSKVSRRKSGGKIGRGCGAAQRGGGKVMK
jgi:hypothetical protein